MNSQLKYVYSKLVKALPKGSVFKNESLKKHTSFKIGGNASVFVIVNSLEEIVLTLDILSAKKTKYFIMGNGTNLLFDDNGFEGVVVKISSKYNQMYCKGNKIVCASGATLNALCNFASEKGLSGLECAYGIPGSVGGAVYMNASAFDYETKNLVSSVLAIIDGKIKLLENLQCEFDYRQSIFSKLKNAIILQVEFTLKKGNKKEINNKMLSIMALRKEKQPLNYPSAGCVFKQHSKINVSKVIDEDGLKGFTIGGAQISKKHSNFIVNVNNASCADVLNIIKYIKNHFLTKYGIEIECEVKYIK